MAVNPHGSEATPPPLPPTVADAPLLQIYNTIDSDETNSFSTVKGISAISTSLSLITQNVQFIGASKGFSGVREWCAFGFSIGSIACAIAVALIYLILAFQRPKEKKKKDKLQSSHEFSTLQLRANNAGMIFAFFTILFNIPVATLLGK